MKPLDSFNAAIDRARHLLNLYDLLHDSRQRGVRSDWADSFKALMHWPASESIVRVDGKDRDSLLVLREAVGIDRDQFSHDYVSELLRASVVAAISALDRYMHDLVLLHSWRLLSKPEDQIPNELKKIAIPVTATKRALRRLRENSTARPGHIVKEAIQEHLHRHYTFQKPDDILKASKMLGVSNFWQSVANEMPVSPTKQDVIMSLRKIAARRNQIVHEADLVRKTKAKEITLRDISRREAHIWIEWMTEFVNAIDRVVANTVT
jgi:hypothetical protein